MFSSRPNVDIFGDVFVQQLCGEARLPVWPLPSQIVNKIIYGLLLTLFEPILAPFIVLLFRLIKFVWRIQFCKIAKAPEIIANCGFGNILVELITFCNIKTVDKRR